jgi:hypothetical protein
MKKIAIRFTIDEYDNVKEIAQDLQRFIVEDDYKILTIIQKIRQNEQIVLDVGMEENMPKFTEVVEAFNENEIEYKLYKSLNGEWAECEVDELELDRTPKWITTLIGINIIWYLTILVVEFFAVHDWYSEKYKWNGFVDFIATIFTIFIPIVGSLVAYWSAIEIWNWNALLALFLFFIVYLPLTLFLLYILVLVLKALFAERWYRFRHPQFY